MQKEFGCSETRIWIIYFCTCLFIFCLTTKLYRNVPISVLGAIYEFTRQDQRFKMNKRDIFAWQKERGGGARKAKTHRRNTERKKGEGKRGWKLTATWLFSGQTPQTTGPSPVLLYPRFSLLSLLGSRRRERVHSAAEHRENGRGDRMAKRRGSSGGLACTSFGKTKRSTRRQQDTPRWKK